MDLLLKRALAELIILELLARKDMYRRQIPQEIQKRSHHLIHIRDSTVFTVTEYLHCRGFLSTTYHGPGKLMLHLEKPGQEYLGRAWTEYDAMTQGMKSFHP